jgi:DnaJ-class molecular chaperone
MSSKLVPCPECRGSGKIVESQGHIKFPRKCETCAGTGKVKRG